MIGNWLSKLAGKQGDKNKKEGYPQHSPACHHAIAAHAEKLEAAGFANQSDSRPKTNHCQDEQQYYKGDNPGVDIQIHRFITQLPDFFSNKIV